MGPPPLVLGLVLNEELCRRLSIQAMLRLDRIVSQQPVGQIPVQGGQVVKQQVLMVIHEPFLEGTIELFGMSVRVRGARSKGISSGEEDVQTRIIHATGSRRHVGPRTRTPPIFP